MPDNLSIVDRANKDAKATIDNVFTMTGSCWIANIAGALVWALYMVTGGTATLVVFILASIGTPIIDAIVSSLNIIRNFPSATMNKLITDVMGEFFGAEFDSSNLSTVPGQQTNLSNMQAIGADIYDLLENEFVPGGELTEDQGTKGAQAFMGFATNFAVRSAVLGILGEAFSMGWITDFREIGEGVAQNLGLGRLIRRALTPLVNTTIAIPAQWALNRKYHPKRLTEAQLFLGLQAGKIDQGDYVDALQQMGYPDESIALITTTIGAHASVDELHALVRYQVITNDGAIFHLGLAGWNNDSSAAALRAQDLKRADVWVHVYILSAAKAYVAGHIDRTTFDGLIAAAPVSDVEKQWIGLAYNQAAIIPHRTLTTAQAELALELRVYSIDDFELHLLNEGYSAADVFTLLQLTLIKQGQMDAAAAAKLAKQKKAAGTTTTPATP